MDCTLFVRLYYTRTHTETGDDDDDDNDAPQINNSHQDNDIHRWFTFLQSWKAASNLWKQRILGKVKVVKVGHAFNIINPLFVVWFTRRKASVDYTNL